MDLTLDTIADAFFTVDSEWRIIHANAAAEVLFLRAPGTFSGGSMWEEWPLLIGTKADQLLREVMRDRVAESLTTLIGEDQRWYEIRAYPVDSGLFGCVRDVTTEKRIEQALRASEENRRLALDAAELGAWNIDPANDMQMFADARFRLICTGSDAPLSYQEAIATIHPDDRARVMASVAAAIAADAPVGYAEEYRVVHPDGTTRWVYAKGRASFDGSGAERQLASFDGTIADVTERKLLNDRLFAVEQQFRSLADNMLQLSWTANADGVIDWYNQRWYDYTGTTFEMMQGAAGRLVHHPEHRERVRVRFQQALDRGEAWEDTFPLRAKDGSYGWFLSRAQPIRGLDGAVVRWLGTNTDVSEQRATAERLRQLVAELSNADRRKNEFLSILAHELRNPLAPLSNGLQLIKLAENDVDAISTVRGMMERQLSLMVRLVDDLMDVSRISHGKVELRKAHVSIADVIGQAVETSRSTLDVGGHTLTIEAPDTPIFVHGDAMRLAQILANLLSNAVKYSNGRAQIVLRAESVGDDVSLSVSDSGIGIAADVLPNVFDLFTQADRSLEKAQGGLGIGLSLVRGLVDLHGGTVEAASDGPGLGSRFTVRLPRVMHAVEMPTPPDRPARTTPLHNSTIRRRVLIADDNVDAAQTLALLLEHMGCQVVTVHDGAQAVERAAAFFPDLIMLDIGMPTLNGYEACKQLRLTLSGRDTMIVALTGWGLKSDRDRSSDAGFDAHLVKPINHVELEELVARLPGGQPLR